MTINKPIGGDSEREAVARAIYKAHFSEDDLWVLSDDSNASRFMQREYLRLADAAIEAISSEKQAAVLAERERCARICDDLESKSNRPARCAAAIRKGDTQ